MLLTRFLREEKGFSQEEVGRMFGLSQSQVSLIETGKLLPVGSLACRIEQFYDDRPISELLEMCYVVSKNQRELLACLKCEREAEMLKAQLTSFEQQVQAMKAPGYAWLPEMILRVNTLLQKVRAERKRRERQI